MNRQILTSLLSLLLLNPAIHPQEAEPLQDFVLPKAETGLDLTEPVWTWSTAAKIPLGPGLMLDGLEVGLDPVAQRLLARTKLAPVPAAIEVELSRSGFRGTTVFPAEKSSLARFLFRLTGNLEVGVEGLSAWFKLRGWKGLEVTTSFRVPGFTATKQEKTPPRERVRD